MSYANSSRVRTATALAVTLLGAAVAPATAAERSLITVIDNSHADSVLEVDRAANYQLGSSGTAGSDHDGAAVDVVEALMGRERSDDED